jgi:hypothetical protein
MLSIGIVLPAEPPVWHELTIPHGITGVPTPHIVMIDTHGNLVDLRSVLLP